MTLLWNEKYEPGQVIIDAEHCEWFRLAIDFLVESNQQSRNDRAQAFSLYTRQHFLNEEILMRQIQYPLIATHVEDHERLLDTLSKLFYVEEKGVLSKAGMEDFSLYASEAHHCPRCPVIRLHQA